MKSRRMKYSILAVCSIPIVYILYSTSLQNGPFSLFSRHEDKQNGKLQNRTFRIVFYTSVVSLQMETLNCIFTFKTPLTRIEVMIRKYQSKRNNIDKTNNITHKINKTNNSIRNISSNNRINTNLRKDVTNTLPTAVKNRTLYKARIKHLIQSVRYFDAVLFHVKDMPGPRVLKSARRKLGENQSTKRKQVWGYYNKESPYNTINLQGGKYDGIFDLVITPLRTSDISAPYGYYHRKSELLSDIVYDDDDDNDDDLKVPFANKTDTAVVWIASHCNEARDILVSSLLEHIPVHVIGKCGKKYKQSHNCPKNSRTCEEKLSRYKFMLAFENSFCTDYVTEKYWNALDRGLVPIVFGGSSYDEKLAIPGSFINVKDFKTVKDLADFITYLSKNQGEYEKYFEWKQNYVLDYKPNDRHRFEIITKKMCLLLNKKETFPKYKLSKFYGRSENCQYQEMLNRKV